jgi:hydroxyacylglutathione hydrolase
MQITEHVHALKIPFKIKGIACAMDRFVYVYLIYGKKIYLIDSGVSTSPALIFDYIRRSERDPADIASIFLTHSHVDHMGGAAFIKKETGCKVIAHEDEKLWIEDIEEQFRSRPIPGFRSLVGKSVEVDVVIKSDQTIVLEENLNLEAIHTPGHTQGSLSYYLKEDKVLCVGDLMPEPKDIIVFQDFNDSVKSLQRLKEKKGVERLLSSWREPEDDDVPQNLLDAGLQYLDQIYETVVKVSGGSSEIEAMELCRRVVEELDLPLIARHIIVARTLTKILKLQKK